MAQENLDEFFLDEDEGVFDPLADDFEPAQDGVDPDEDGIVDLPVMAEMPEEVKVKSVFDKDRFASAQDNHIVYLEHPNVWYTAEGGITALDYMLADLEQGLGLDE